MTDPASNRDGAGLQSDVAPRAGKRFALPARTAGALVSATRGRDDRTVSVVVTANARGDTWIALAQVAATESDGAAPLAEQMSACLFESTSLHAAVAAIRQRLEAATHGGVAALGIIGLSPSDDCAEILNAGLPPIVCSQRDGGVVTFPARSGPLMIREHTAHPYERVALAWEASWLMVPRLGNNAGREAMIGRASQLDLRRAGPVLASMPGDALTRHVRLTLAGDPAADTTLVIATARRALDRGSTSV